MKLWPSKPPTCSWLTWFSRLILGGLLGLFLLYALLYSLDIFNPMPRKTPKKFASVMCQTLVNTAEAFFEDHRRYPVPTEATAAAAKVRRTTSPEDGLVDILLGNNPVENPRSIDYLGSIHTATLTKTETPRNGLAKIGTSHGIYDPWGQPYIIEIDTSLIPTNPAPQQGMVFPRGAVIVYSAGPDGNYDTLSDNINTSYN